MATWVKVCGLVEPRNAERVAAAGADAIGLNFVATSSRLVSLEAAREIAAAVRGRAELVGVVADLDPPRCEELLEELALDRLQLHGSEPADWVASLLPRAYKACRLRGEADARQAAAFPGPRLLVDAWVPGALGGQGVSFEWSWAIPLATRPELIVAGGLRPENVSRAIGVLDPFGVDVATGVEQPGTPGVKDLDLVRRFLDAARASDRRP